jgi:hypothetical protein
MAGFCLFRCWDWVLGFHFMGMLFLGGNLGGRLGLSFGVGLVLAFLLPLVLGTLALGVGQCLNSVLLLIACND